MTMFRKTKVFLFFIFIFFYFNLNDFVSAHVSLTFPPARKFNLDYLDSGSPPPCGMPKGNIKTSLISGSTFNVTWHLGYPHQGSHRIEILSTNGTQLYTLASERERNDPTASNHQVTLPSNFTCKDCIIRLLRQSAELRNPFYWFWSCGDVDILQKEEYIETCSGNGFVSSSGTCVCAKGFFGVRCAYENECEDSGDCGGGAGECVDLGGSNLPRKQCFCKSPFIGKKCTKTNTEGKIPLPTPSTLTKELLETKFKNFVLDPRVHLYWRLINVTSEPEQIEFVLYVNGTSYGALGWRPLDFQGDCTRYPLDEQNSIRSSRRVRRQESNPGLVNSNLTSELPNEENLEPYFRLHPMSCCDVVIGAAKGRLYRILDYWSGDISTPREDTFWDGTEDIMAGTGWEVNGVTTLIFRKKSHGKDIDDRWNDWHLMRPSHVIWARGQEHGEYVHSLPSGLDSSASATNKPSIPLFYTQDEIKYHGFRGQRGYTEINFM